MKNRNDTPMVVVGPNHLAYVKTSPAPMSPVHTNAAAFQVSRKLEFKDLCETIALRLRPFAIGKEEYSICEELRKGRSLSIRGFEILCRIAARSECPFVIEEAVRGFVIQEMAAPTPCAFEASESEQQSNEPLNLAQLLAHKEKTPVRWGQVAKCGEQQVFATRRLVDAARRLA